MKDTVLLAEFFPVKGHSLLFDNTADILLKNANVVMLVPNNYNGKHRNAIRMHYNYYQESKSYTILKRLCYLLYCFKVVKCCVNFASKEKITKIICLTYEECSLALYFPFISKSISLYIMHHNNVDRFFSSRISSFMFSFYSNKVINIVQCGFMAKSIQDFFCLSNVAVWPHPLNKLQFKIWNDKVYSCVGLSSSNDQTLVDELVQWEKDEMILKKHNLKIVLKSKGQPYDDGFLKVINSYISTEDYNNYISLSKSLLIPFPKSFRYRMSGSLVDALTNNKYVIATSIPVVRECKKAYPSLIYIYNRESFINDLITISKLPDNNNEFDKFKEFHSSKNLEYVYMHNLTIALNNRSENIFDF